MADRKHWSGCADQARSHHGLMDILVQTLTVLFLKREVLFTFLKEGKPLAICLLTADTHVT